MKKLFDLQNNNRLIHIFALGILFTAIWAKFFAIGDAFYSDPFHHGEFVASLQSVFAGNVNFFTIHGAMDWLPALFSQHFFELKQYFQPTMLAYNTLSALASLFLYATIVLLTSKNNQYRAVILMVSAAVSVYLVGIRDVFLLLTIWVYFLSERCSSKQWRNLLELALGVALAANLFWSFDRGVVGIAGIGFACLIMVVKEKRHLLSMVSFILSLGALHWLGALSFSNYVANFQFLLATSSQWSYGFAKNPIILSALVAIPNGWAIYYLVKQLHQTIRVNWKETANLISLVILTILMYKIGINRADGGHVIMALWMPALVFLYLHERCVVKWTNIFNITIIISIMWLAKKSGVPVLYFGMLIPAIYVIQTKFPKLTYDLASPKLAIIALAIPLLFANTLKISSQYTQGSYQWTSKISAPPTNQSLVSESIQWVSTEISNTGSSCIFDLSNNGVINGITSLPACTKYIYPVYATQRYEADMLKELQQKNPPVIVFSSTYWSFSIDGKSMHDRFPALKNYLLKTYPYEKCNLGYCLRYMNQPS